MKGKLEPRLLKIDQTKLMIVSLRAKDRHNYQDDREEREWGHVRESAISNRAAASYLVEAEISREKLESLQGQLQATSEREAKAYKDRAAALAAATAANERASSAESDSRIAVASVVEAKAKADAAVMLANRALAGQAKALKAVRKYVEKFKTSAQLSSADEVGLTPKERKIRLIVESAKKIGFDTMSIPTGGKKRLGYICIESYGTFFYKMEQFNDAWREAVSEGRIRTERHDDYAARKK